MGLLLEKRLCLSCHLDLELIVVLDDARQRGKALELEPEESPIRDLCVFRRMGVVCWGLLALSLPRWLARQ